MSRHFEGRIDDRTHYVSTHQANVDGYGFSESPGLGLGDWPLLDTTHAETAVHYRTHWNCSGGSATPPLEPHDIARQIQPGHTNLYIEEKRLVIVNGRVRAVWPQAFEGDLALRFLVAGSTLREALVVAPAEGHGVGSVAQPACRLSELTGRPVVVVRQLATLPWH